MTRVVIDTNVLISALITHHGPEASVLSLVIAGRLVWCVSPAVIAEYRDVVSRPKFRRISLQTIHGVMETLARATSVIPVQRVSESKDEADNRFLECAEAARADYLITGNKRHFPKQWKGTVVLNARDFLDTYEQ
jgi:putative PIN family toxin of toxin-antitoxin system